MALRARSFIGPMQLKRPMLHSIIRSRPSSGRPTAFETIGTGKWGRKLRGRAKPSSVAQPADDRFGLAVQVFLERLQCHWRQRPNYHATQSVMGIAVAAQ